MAAEVAALLHIIEHTFPQRQIQESRHPFQKTSQNSRRVLTSFAVNRLIITVDGPSGTGKSTVSKAVAVRANLPHLDTGAFYRAATLAALRSEVDLEDSDAVGNVVKNLSMDQDKGHMFLDGEDVSDEIRGDRVTGAVSSLSTHPKVREMLVRHQRDWVDQHGGQGVVEGRDIGSVVFPDAALKIYLDARAEVRASRRALQVGDDPDDVIKELERRDHIDSTRPASPLTVPEGAIVVDTSDLDFDAVVERVLSLIPVES
jgi:cytidylate kinase